MVQDIDPTVQRRRLRVRLRQAREATGLTQKDAAQKLRWGTAKIIRIETGQVGISATDLTALLGLYGITDPDQVAAYVEMAMQSRKQHWSVYRDVLNQDFLIYLGFEGSASVLRQSESLILPGLLQTEEYARAVIHAFNPPGTSPRHMNRQLEVRMRRQEILDRADPPTLFFILDEAVIRRAVGAVDGSARVMQRQLAHLNDIGRRHHVHLRVVRFSHGAHIGLMGPFAILEFPDDGDDDLLFLENGPHSLATREDASVISLYLKQFAELENHALSEADTADLIDEVRAQM
ncbi:helix-turn-helix transcriptional regulator [Micromonospora sp. WMMD1082]|uniref:helix-turn-helix domain-containing protein n=1 Tax=Micromonospora sp. WMMD1082 TaxID=3016104 RepID=UPI00241618AB|nr:helix-turn-helix transcriptional regulator [Micromonospora sp. WMMD1082]MDG4795112.1 helix-turn-helix transcriptional regulator [Micromonospora sp. WMMD1082]